MEKGIIAIVMLAIVLTAGCAGIGDSPSDVVETFVSKYEDENYDECYDMMSSNYQKYTDFAAFVSICKDADPDRYEFIEIEDEYIYQDEAVVDVLVNKTSSGFGSWIESIIDDTPETGIVTEQIELVKQEDEWKLTEFPYALT